jgi:ATP-dependent Clp protease ATP-binding subunit ClpB
LNRIDEVVLFQLLSKSQQKFRISVEKFNEMLEKRNIILTATEDALKYLTNKGYDPVFGARP